MPSGSSSREWEAEDKPPVSVEDFPFQGLSWTILRFKGFAGLKSETKRPGWLINKEYAFFFTRDSVQASEKSEFYP